MDYSVTDYFMNLNIMRWVDKNIGVPLCFFVSVLDKTSKLFGINKPDYKRQIKKALFIELSEMGSTILAYPAMRRLKQAYPKAELYFLIFNENKESVKLLGIIPNSNILTIRINSSVFFVLDTISTLFKIRKLKFDAVFDLELFARFTAIITGLSKGNLKVGFYKYTMESLYRGDFLTHKISYNPHMHISMNFMSLVQSLNSGKDEVPMTKRNVLGFDVSVPKPKLSDKNSSMMYKKLKEINPAFGKSSKLVVFNPNAGLLPIRAWPLKNYAELARKIADNHKDTFIAVMGVKDASKDAKIINGAIGNRCIDLTNKTTLKEVVDLFNISKVLVTNDSGPAHFASLTPIKNFVFFGPETPRLYCPLGKNTTPLYSDFACSPCVSAFNHRKTICKDNKCLKAIKVDDAYNLIKKEL
jgi:ADP-heptose:LPS heptosyltransferase